MDVRPAHENEADLPWSWAHLLQAQLLGEDPTSGWRALVVAGVRAGRGVDVSPAMPAAFVLQWSLEVAAEAGLYAAWQLRGIHDPVDSGLTFAVHPTQGYPTGARFRALSPAPPPAAADGVDLVSANLDTYRRAAVELAASYHPGVNLGRQQRTEMVADVWDAAVARRQGQPPPARRSCCYIYVLPGAHECAGCPRRGAAR
ncbi:MAG TPA: (2Fe-2S)-binding protein [Pedococcus sp.]|nr:(2Fe-2S)-binding protein [Pedococcus sp.]